MRKALLNTGAVIATIALTGCCPLLLGPADGSLRLTGQIDNVPPESYGFCDLQLHDTSTGEPYELYQERVGGAFDVFFVVDPCPGTYFATITCYSSDKEFVSEDFVSSQDLQPIDLGVIDFDAL